MNYDRKEFLDRVAENRKKRVADQMPALLAAQAVAPVMEKLKLDEHWTRYLQHIQDMLNQCETAKARADKAMRDPMIWDAKDLSKLKSDLIAAEAMIEAFTLCMKLPEMLIENAEIAKQTIARFESQNDNATGQPQS